MAEETNKSLAQRCFESTDVGDELFYQVTKILGGSTKGYNLEDFEVLDTFWDNYDSSVEVIRSEKSQFMSREQANQILDLGFNYVYETCGSIGRAWTKNGYSACSPSIPDEVLRLKTIIKNLKEQQK